jgi:hypothetical protein
VIATTVFGATATVSLPRRGLICAVVTTAALGATLRTVAEALEARIVTSLVDAA